MKWEETGLDADVPDADGVRDAVAREKGTPSATDPAMDTWTFAEVVEGQADRLVEMAESVRGTVEGLASNLASVGGHDADLPYGDLTEGDIALLREQVAAIVAHAPTVVEHARALVALYADEAQRRSSARRRGTS